jgi:hypothetical protein
MFARKLDIHSISTIQQQMFMISDILLSIGKREEALLVQDSNNWEFAYDFINLIKDEAIRRKDATILNRLDHIWIVRGLA